MKTLYHGSDKNIRTIDLQKGNAHTDFGKGFYLAYELNNAKEWGKSRNRLKYYVSKFEVPDNIPEAAISNGLNVKYFAEANQEWAEFVFNNRNNENFTHEYDIVIGPVADNDLQEWFAKMKRENLSFADIASKIDYRKFRKPQVCFRTQGSLKLLKKLPPNTYITQR